MRMRGLLVGGLIVLLIWPDGVRGAYETSLNEQEIGEAYSLGQRNDRATAEFVGHYLGQAAEEGADGLHRVDIEVLTPFLQIVDRARDNSRGYSFEQAKADYRQRGDTIAVRITLVLPANYPVSTGGTGAACDNTALEPQNFWTNFAFVVKQHGKAISARSVRNEPIYSAPTKDVPSRLDGANVWLDFNAKDVASDALIVDVVTPRCKTITATFDLASLR